MYHFIGISAEVLLHLLEEIIIYLYLQVQHVLQNLSSGQGSYVIKALGFN